MNRKADYSDFGGWEEAAGRIERRMQALAARMRPDGTARLRLNRSAVRQLEEALDAANRLRGAVSSGGEALERLCRDGGFMRVCARQASQGGGRLPACGGQPRIWRVMDRLLRKGDAPLTQEDLLAALEAFDSARPLTMAELWQAPLALRIALTQNLLEVSGEILACARDCAAAERWLDQPGPLSPATVSAAFVEHALMRSAEEELPDRRARLAQWLARRNREPGAEIRAAHAAKARQLLRLGNLLDGCRMLDQLNWQRCFDRISRVEAELTRDPGGIYPRMDEISRAAVREQTARLARKLDMTELAVARSAVDASTGAEGTAATVCWWLYDDAGRCALAGRLGRGDARLPRLVPDPSGHRLFAVFALAAAAILAALACAAESPWLWPCCIPLAWSAAMALIGRFFPRIARPVRLLKLEMDDVPEACRTLVTIPALLSCPQRVDALCGQLEALGCLEADDNMEYLLLGDFADAPQAEMPDDEALLARAREHIAAMNARAGREKYALLFRPRTLLSADGRWMGRDRKRGALMALNRVLLGEPGAEEAFSEEGQACDRLKGRFAYVVTLDADTRLLPETVRRMIGAMAHPLNARYAVLQPRMEPLPSACVNAFSRLFGGAGGLSAYPVSVSDLWQDITGRGVYAGKGIYRIADFQARLDGALPEGRVLSHDLIEGALAGAGTLGDVALYDGCPTTLAAWIRRRHRWIRGDWQLLRLLRCPGLTGVDRFRMVDNLLRSLREPALLALLLGAFWTGNAGALAAAALLCAQEPLLSLFRGDARKWRLAAARLTLLPVDAWCALDAVLRTLWRLFVSGRHLLDWVTAADSEGGSGGLPLDIPGRAAAILLLPGLRVSGWAPACLALAALFLVGPGWMRDLEAERTEPEPAIDGAQRRTLNALAAETWRFFENYVPAGSALPPDNVQIDPPRDPARRTSPTNIALYLTGCLSALRLKLIDTAEMNRRLDAAIAAMEAMPKWRGHLFNWIGTDTGLPMPPRYVSSVDSGNLAAALLLCAAAAETRPELARRMEALAQAMDFTALYDAKRDLFRIGVDAESGRPSSAHYDLLASESRILSFTAMMLGQVPTKHWRALGRGCVPAGGVAVALSWSGTMFEYLMPELFMHAPANTLLGEGIAGAIKAQRRQGRRTGRPWGVSESGYCAFDAELNYQYRAFGLPELALDGEASADVVAPYASALAAMIVPAAAAENIARMTALGWRGPCGLYEAADYRHSGTEGGPAVVRSHMAHHQGMILCALCNALTGGSLRADFMGRPEARGLSLLLEERPCDAAKPRRAGADVRPGEVGKPIRRAGSARRGDVLLLHGDGATVIATPDGAIHYRRFGVDATRFDGDLRSRRNAACARLSVKGVGDAVLGLTGFEPGLARGHCSLGRVEAAMEIAVSPEDGTLVRRIELRNGGNRTVRASVTDVAPVALARPRDWQAHAAFCGLFVRTERIGSDLLAFRGKARTQGNPSPVLVHLAAGPGPVERGTDYRRLAGREGDPLRPGGLGDLGDDPDGRALDPVSALRVQIEVPPGERRELHFALALLPQDAEPGIWADRYRDAASATRAIQLAAARARALLDFIGLKPSAFHLANRLASLCLDGRLAAGAKAGLRGEPPCREALWALGISGDRPLMVVRVTSPEGLHGARQALRAHELWRAAELEVDLALIDDGEGGYARPVWDALNALVDAGSLRTLQNLPGGVFLIDGRRLPAAARDALASASSLWLEGDVDFLAQAQALTASAAQGEGRAMRVMRPGASRLPEESRTAENGWGGFLPEGGYAIDVRPGKPTPAPWCWILANDFGGLMITERGGGFFWQGNSRSGRLTPWSNDPLRERWGLMLYLIDDARKQWLRLLPGDVPQMPFRARFDAASARYAFDNERLAGRVDFFMAEDRAEVRIDVQLENRGLPEGDYRLAGCVDWLMGVDAGDLPWVRTWESDGACLASGACGGVGYFASGCAGATAGPDWRDFIGEGTILRPAGFDAPCSGGGHVLNVPLRLRWSEPARIRLALGWAEDARHARLLARALRTGEDWTVERARQRARALSGELEIETPDPLLNRFAAGFLVHQVRAARVLGRTGYYQPGGAWGFRDQLQDMLTLLHYEPDRVRAHLLRCAACQFEAGDVLHWWHEPLRGVRTRISDDRLFLPWAVAAYVEHTGDTAVLSERIPYLKDVEIPADREDVYADMTPGEHSDSLDGHCMRALRSAARFGAHGLLLMGAGDWNDGMNRVGIRGRGESVWLSEFALACAERYAEIAGSEDDRAWLRSLSGRLRTAIEENGWDGAWYRRAYDDDGRCLGSASNRECRIDAIAQAWAELAGLDPLRCQSALDAAWDQLADEETGIIRLLAPPFEGRDGNPGYIADYPAGVRENGAQYTHGALWLLLALIHQGDAARAHKALGMLLPYRHSDSPRAAERYRVEPYVMAADVYEGGRGGWTWYTGAAGWMHACLLALLGYERKGNRVRLNALLGEWPWAAVSVRFGESRYRLVCDRQAQGVELDGKTIAGDSIAMVDDGGRHEARFQAREEARRQT